MVDLSRRHPSRTREGWRLYLGRVISRPYPHLVGATIVLVPVVGMTLGGGDGGVGWSLWTLRAVPVHYVAPLVGLALGGALGAEDSKGLAAVLPSVGLSRSRQILASTAALGAASAGWVLFPLLVSGMVARLVFADSGSSGSVADASQGIGFVISAVAVAGLVWTYAVVEYVAGRRVGAVGSVVAWLSGVNVASAFLPIGVDMITAFRADVSAYLLLGACCVLVVAAANLVAWRAEP